MSPRATGVLLVLALLLGAFIYLYEGGRDPADVAPGERDLVFAGLDGSDVDWIELTTRDGVEARLERAGTSWRVTEPLLAMADSVVLDGIASQLATLEVEGRVEGAEKLSDFGLDERAARVRFGAGGQELTLLLGKPTPVGSNTYVRRGDGAEVAYVTSWRTSALAKELAELRDRRVLDFDHTTIDRVEVQWPEGEVVLAKSEGQWRMLRPVEQRADRGTVQTLLSDLAFLSADGFIDEPDARMQAAFDSPRLTVRLRGSNEGGVPFEQQLDFGPRAGEQQVVRAHGESLLLVEPERLDDVPRDVTAYRFKTLARFDPEEVTRASILFADEAAAFEAVRSEGGFEMAPVQLSAEAWQGVLAALSRVEGSGIVAERMGEDELASLGLSPPRLRIEVEGQGGEVLADFILGRRRGRRVFAMRADSDIVYGVDATWAERVPANHAELVALGARRDLQPLPAAP